MSKSSTASAPKNPTPLPAKSAWARGPPQTATAPSPRSQSPVPSTPTHQTHSRRSSTLGPGIPIKDGVSVPRNNIGAVKQGSAVTFGSIDDVSAPISSSPAAAPALKSEGVKSFGTVPATGHVNGKASISSRSSVVNPTASSSSSSSAATTPAAATTAAPVAKPKIDIKKMFQNPTSTPSSTPPSESSPLQRNVNLPVQQQSSMHQGQPNHPPHTPLGGHSFTPFVPSAMRPPQNSGPNGGPPRSPQYSRQMPNGNGPRSQGGQNGGPPAGLSSPRLGPHPHNGQPSQMPPPPPPSMQSQIQPQMHQMGMPWAGYYPYPPPDQQHYMYAPQWYSAPMPVQPPHGQHQPQTPGPHLSHGGGMPMSPRNPPSSLQAPGTPTLPHALPNPVHAPHPPPSLSHASNSIGGLTSPPPTPSSASIPSNRLNATSSAFVPRTKVTLKKEDGTEINLEHLKSNPIPVTTTATPTPQGSAYRQGSPGTPTRRPASIRMETEDQRKQRLAQDEQKEKEQSKIKAEAEEKARKEKEEAGRKAKEAEDKKRQEEEAEKERIRKEEELKEAERLRKEEEERARKEAEERARKEAEEREAQRIREEEEEKERIRKEAKAEEAKRIAEEKAKKEEERRLEQERLEKERLVKEKAEQERLAKEAEETRIRLEQDEAAKLAQRTEKQPEPDAAQDGKSESTIEEGELVEDGKDAEPVAPLKEDGKDKLKEGLRINTGAVSPTVDRRQRPGPLDLTNAKSSNIPAPQSALATARIISDISSVSYPEGVSSPRPDLNQGAKEGKFRYDRDFLLQFMSICKEKPAMLPPLDAIGLEPADQASLTMTRGGSGRRQGPGGAPSSRQGSIGLGFPAGTFNKGPASSFSMGNFATMGGNKLSSEDRFAAASTRPVSVSGAAGMQYSTNRPAPVTRTLSQGGPGAPLRDRTRSKRGEKRGENNKPPGGQGGGGQQGHGGGYNNYQNQQQQMNLEPVAPLQATANRWDRKSLQVDADSPEMVDRKVKGLLNKLTMEKFDSISDQIISWANKSEKEKDGRTLIQVIRLVFEKATDEATWSEMYARLCRKMMEQISPKVQDDGIKNNEGKPIAGGQLFRKYLLNRCQEDFERGWVAKEATAAAAASKALEDEAIKAANDKTKEDGKEDEVVLYSEEYYAAQKAKRQGLGLIKFIGELFKLQMLTERIMHECVKKLLGNVDNPEEEEIESLCKLLGTVGGILDTQKARAHLDVYFSRMKELTKSPNVTPRMQYMLQDLVELRERKWVTRNTVAAPTTIAQIHETAAKEKAAQEKESYQRQISMSRGGSRRGGDRGDFAQANPDGWAVAGGGSGPPRPPPKAGDLSNFGKISKAQPMTFGPSSVFAGKKGTESKRESISRTSSNSNMFSMLSAQSAEAGDAAAKVVEPTQRKRLVLQPRSKPVELESADGETGTGSPAAESESGTDAEDEAAAEPEMTEAEATKKIKEDLKEFFAVRNLEEAETYFKLPPQHHHLLVDKLVSTAIESKEADAKLVSDFFDLAFSKELCSAAAFEDGFTPIAELIDDIAIDAPKAFQLFAMMIKGARLDEDRRTRLASKSIDSDKLLALLQ